MPRGPRCTTSTLSWRRSSRGTWLPRGSTTSTAHPRAGGIDPSDGESPRPDAPLAQLPNAVLTPHIGGASYNVEANHARMMGDGIAGVLRGGGPTNEIKPPPLPHPH